MLVPILFLLILFLVFREVKETFECKDLELKTTAKDDLSNYINQRVACSLKEIKIEKGDRGPKGEQGVKGESGGTYLEKGVLRSVENPTKVIERKDSAITMNDVNYKSTQGWYLDENNQIRSIFNRRECLDATDGNIKVERCPDSTEWIYIDRTSQLQSKEPIGGERKCLDYNNGNLKMNKCIDITPAVVKDVKELDQNLDDQAWAFF